MKPCKSFYDSCTCFSSLTLGRSRVLLQKVTGTQSAWESSWTDALCHCFTRSGCFRSLIWIACITVRRQKEIIAAHRADSPFSCAALRTWQEHIPTNSSTCDFGSGSCFISRQGCVVLQRLCDMVEHSTSRNIYRSSEKRLSLLIQDDLLTCSIYNSFALSPEALEISALCARGRKSPTFFFCPGINILPKPIATSQRAKKHFLRPTSALQTGFLTKTLWTSQMISWKQQSLATFPVATFWYISLLKEIFV